MGWFGSLAAFSIAAVPRLIYLMFRASIDELVIAWFGAARNHPDDEQPTPRYWVTPIQAFFLLVALAPIEYALPGLLAEISRTNDNDMIKIDDPEN